MRNNNSCKLNIRPLLFAPSIADRFEDSRRVHVVGYNKCNYRCEFCSFGKWQYHNKPEYTAETFEQKIWEMVPYSLNFKFTGGEPTLNPMLPELMRITKLYQGRNFLDTNGSRPEKVKALIDEGLVDILGISLKGLNEDEAAMTANIKNKKMSFRNVFESIKYGSENENVSVVITCVACEGFFNPEDLETLYELLKPFPDITLKINNCYLEERIDFRRKGLDKCEIYNIVKDFVEKHPEYKGRTVLFRDHDSCIDPDKVAYF